MATPEIKTNEAPPVLEVPEQVEQTPVMESEGVEPVQTAAPAQASIPQPLPSQPITPVPQPSSQVSTITIPADPQQLTQLSKGSASNSLTWFAVFWLRAVKKALKKHFAVVVGNNP